jgi:hypothetical protein
MEGGAVIVTVTGAPPATSGPLASAMEAVICAEVMATDSATAARTTVSGPLSTGAYVSSTASRTSLRRKAPKSSASFSLYSPLTE